MDPLSFLGGTLLGATSAHVARRLSGPRAPREGLGDLLGWAFLIDEGVILMKDGAFLAGLSLRGRDLESATAQEVNRAASSAHEALALLGAGYALEVNIHRRETADYPSGESSHFPTPALRALESERRAQFLKSGEHFTTENTVLLSYAPPKEVTRRWERLVVQGAAERLDYKHILGRFKRAFGEFEAVLGAAFFVRRMTSEALLTECHRCLTGHDHAVPAPHTPHSYLSYALSSGAMVTGFQPVVDGRYVFVLTVSSFGPHTEAAASDFFNRLRERARWHMRFVGMSRHDAERRIRKLQTRWFHQRGGLRALVSPGEVHAESFEDQDAAAMQAETGGALADAASGRARFGYFSNTIVLRDRRRERGVARAHALLQTLRDQGFACSLESINATDALVGSLPGHGYANLRRPLLSSRNVAHLFPTTTPWPGAAACPSSLFPKGSPPLLYARACGATPFRVNLHQGDVGHTLVVGATGSGKSVLVSLLALSFLRYANSRVFLFDVGASHLIPTLAAGGRLYDFGGDLAPALQPLRHLDSETDRLWALAWLETVFDLCGASVGPRERLELARAVDLLAQSSPQQRTLTALHVTLPRRLQEVLEPYTVKGAFGRILDGSGDAIAVERMQSYELSGVLHLRDAFVAPLLLTLFRSIERSLDGTPTLIIIEEAWAALLRSTFAERMQEWLLTLRKRNAALVVVAHSVGQLRALPHSEILTESCPTRIMLPNPEARAPDHAEGYRLLDLGAREIEIIATAQRRRDYYYKSPAGSRLFELNLGRAARTLLMPLPGMAVEDSTRLLRDFITRRGDAFMDHIADLSTPTHPAL